MCTCVHVYFGKYNNLARLVGMSSFVHIHMYLIMHGANSGDSFQEGDECGSAVVCCVWSQSGGKLSS